MESSSLLFKVIKSRNECNICHFKCNGLDSDAWHKNIRCPKCGSDVRKRLFVATLFNLDKGKNFQNSFLNKSVLHFAPEKIITRLVVDHCKEYKTADYLTEGYEYDQLDLIADISKMETIASKSFDTVIAMDVLEHVENDKAAISEIYRVLKSGGTCFLTVPQKDDLKITYDDPSITEPREREEHFGQFDHLRIYGSDFRLFLESAGFKVEMVEESNFPKEVVSRFVLKPPILSNHPLATNNRIVYIGRKE